MAKTSTKPAIRPLTDTFKRYLRAPVSIGRWGGRRWAGCQGVTKTDPSSFGMKGNRGPRTIHANDQ